MKTATEQPVPRHTVLWLLAALLMVVLPHVPRLPLTVTALFLIFISWRYCVCAYAWPCPKKVIRILLAGVAIATVYTTYGNLMGRDPGIALLVTMLGVKLLEMDSHRDVYITVLIGYFLVITHFLYSQSILTALYMFTVVIVITGSLIDLNRQHQQGATVIGANLRLSASLLAQASPFMVVFFILFPRIGSPLWGLPSDAYGGTTGLGDSMSPGQISQLSQSDRVAFRVKFDGPPPPPSQRYWRGPVFWHTDGRRWQPKHPRQRESKRNPPPFTPIGDPVSYTVTLEAHKRRWLYALDLPITVPEFSNITADYQLHAIQDIKQRVRYQVVSHPSYHMDDLSAAQRRRALQLPRGTNTKTAALGRAWRNEFEKDYVIVNQALAMYAMQPFIYTLTPPLLSMDNPTDMFLFETKKGFCEHYASSFTMLMRAAGVPARVVTGYQGGELNPVGNYLIVRQRDAHAWAEVWLEGRGWVRVDPTAAVAPERVEMSINNVAQREGDSVQFELPESAAVRAIVEQLRLSWDAVNNSWNQWILNYNQVQQRNFLAKLGLGIESWKGMVTALTISVTGLIMLVAGYILLQRFHAADPVTTLWLRYCRKLARRGINRRPAEGPRDFAHRVALLRPDLKPQSDLISDLYITLRYSPQPTENDVSVLRHRVREFRP